MAPSGNRTSPRVRQLRGVILEPVPDKNSEVTDEPLAYDDTMDRPLPGQAEENDPSQVTTPGYVRDATYDLEAEDMVDKYGFLGIKYVL